MECKCTDYRERVSALGGCTALRPLAPRFPPPKGLLSSELIYPQLVSEEPSLTSPGNPTNPPTYATNLSHRFSGPGGHSGLETKAEMKNSKKGPRQDRGGRNTVDGPKLCDHTEKELQLLLCFPSPHTSPHRVPSEVARQPGPAHTKKKRCQARPDRSSNKCRMQNR